MRYIMHYFKQFHTYAGKVLYLNLLGMMAISFFEGVAILLIIPIIHLSGVVDMDIQAIPFLDSIHFIKDFSMDVGLPLLLGVYILLVVIQQLIHNKLAIQGSLIHVGFLNQLRTNIYHSILQAKWGFFIKRRKSDLINALTSELGRVNSGISQLLNFITSILYTVIQIGIALLLSPTITLFVLVCGLILNIFTRKFIKQSQSVGKNTTEINNSYYAGITDHFNGMKEIKSNNIETSIQFWLRTLNERIVHERLEMTKIRNKSQFMYKATSAILIAFFIYFSLKLFHSQPEQLLLVVIIFSNLWPKLTSIQSNMESIAASIPAFETLYHLQTECTIERETSTVTPQSKNEPTLQVGNGMECKDVYYRYNKDDSNFALKDITISIPSNRTTAIVGRSGAGKSTLIDILMGLIPAEQGQVSIDGTPITGDNVTELRSLISYVPQDPFLFNGSIRDNLVMVYPDATEEDIWESLKFAAADEFVSRLPEGIDTVIGDRGIRLSGGERQRLVMARAILRKPSILVLDEATSALDTENEAKIQEALDRLNGKITIIIIAHRLSTIRNADQVIVLDNGQVIQKGGFGELAGEESGLFSHLLERQLEVSR